MRKCVVVSAVNFSEGGPLTVLRDCLASAVLTLPDDWEIVALVHDKKLIDQPRVRLIEIPETKHSWFQRIRFEWFGFKSLSRELNPDLWFSLHDITPRVLARRQAVYCHNPSPFYRLSWREVWMAPRFWLFNHFYRYLYRLFIHRNRWVVVQQSWLRDEFIKMFGSLPIVVAHPDVREPINTDLLLINSELFIFFYPALPRVFKNFEVICDAVNILNSRGVKNFEIRLTIDGHENQYSNWLFKKYSATPGISFIGLQNREQMANQYRDASVVVFPSKLETWGLPISEAKIHHKPLLVASLPYAYETVGNYDDVSFFDPNDPTALADLMQDVVMGCRKPSGAVAITPSQPFTKNWDDLWLLLTRDL